jgi:hypothetical protein
MLRRLVRVSLNDRSPSALAGAYAWFSAGSEIGRVALLEEASRVFAALGTLFLYEPTDEVLEALRTCGATSA